MYRASQRLVSGPFRAGIRRVSGGLEGYQNHFGEFEVHGNIAVYDHNVGDEFFRRRLQ